MKTLFSIIFLAALPVLKSNDIDNLPINKIQVIGSHNSYKKAIEPALFKFFQQKDSVSSTKIDYEHLTIEKQLDMGLCNLEIDVYADEKGGRFAHPKGLEMVKNQAPYNTDGVMDKPGFKVLHIPDLDFRTQFSTLANGLQQLKHWSDAHPNHYPIFITLEAKDAAAKPTDADQTNKLTEAVFAELDQTLRNNLGTQNILTPDIVRGKNATLNDAVTQGTWPTVKAARGKFLFILDDKSSKRDLYIEGHPSLKNRMMFSNSEAGTPEAAMMIRNDPKDPAINDLVKKGYIIRTRADNDTQQARKNDKTDFVAACNSGAQIITTDYYLKSTHFKSDYSVSFEGGKYFRVNPVFNK
ncbi:MAG: phosphatidylinositol-specific phospholipase C1-like protein [Janthinobacterium lividum]